jgi:hypothetical protein
VAISARSALPGIDQECRFAFPSEDRVRTRGARRNEAALNGGFAEHFPHRDGLAISLDLMLADKQVLEESLRQPMRCRPDKNATRFGKRLEPRC